MSVQTVDVLQNSVPNTQRGPSEFLWGGQGIAGGWIADFISDPSLGFAFYDEFQDGAPSTALTTSALAGSYGAWGLYAYANATVVDASQYGGVIQLLCGTTTNQGIALTKFAGCVQMVDSTTTPTPGPLVFEARVLVNNITTTAAAQFDAFVGLTDKGKPAAGIPITTTSGSLYNTMNCIGFQRKASVGNDWSFVYQASGVAAVYPTNLQTLVSTVTGSAVTASQYVKLGFIYNNNALPVLIGTTTTGGGAIGTLASPKVIITVNGQPAAAFLQNVHLTSSNFPQGFMSPAVAVMNASTTTGLGMNVDWVRVAQRAWL